MLIFHKRAWAEVDTGKLKRNIEKISSCVTDKTELIAVVKADAYGHGAREVCKCLTDCGVNFFAVSNLDEAKSVRSYCPESDILILGYSSTDYAKVLVRDNIIQGVVSLENAQILSEKAEGVLRCHIKLDTGMGRIGVKHNSIMDSADEIEAITKLPNLSVEGIYTHFAVADSENPEDVEYTKTQRDTIVAVYDELVNRGIKLKHLHFLNSAGTMYHYDERSTLARVGIIMYGLHPNSEMKMPIEIEPIMELKAIISQVKTIEKGDFVSYGRTFKADKSITLATVPIGYADGYSRFLSSKGEALVRGTRCKIVGRVCMDQLMLDVSHIPDLKVDEIVTLIGRDGDEVITADDVASLYGTIGYEVVCGISKRVPRIVK